MPTRFELANAIRALAMDAVQRADSGHPGMPMGMADIAEVLWNSYLRHNPADPKWFNRDRFVVSNGHGSLLLYAALHLSGYDLPMEELKHFRQLHSRTPGHPEYGLTPGVETTTGPLGQGLANAVGMAIAERLMAAEFNRDDFPVVDHHTYVFAGDGCMMEGISHEACSLAGTLGLGKLVVFYDDNGISIDGQVHGWFRDDTPGRFEAYGWQVMRKVNGHDPTEISIAIEAAKSQSARPTLICCKTIIGFGAPDVEGTAKAHGSVLGESEIAAARKKLGWNSPPFEIPQEVYAGWDARTRGSGWQAAWNVLLTDYAKQYADAAAELKRRIDCRLPPAWPRVIAAAIEQGMKAGKPAATRISSEAVLDLIAPALPEFIGGSADLTKSNNTHWKAAKTVEPGVLVGNYISYGVREFGMSAAMNGMAVHGGVIPFGGTFLVFSDYARNAVRLSALMKQRVIFVFTHDSIGLGQDGPTHQPIEQLASLRLIPNLHVWRPADAFETALAWKAAVERDDGPTVLALSRQNLTQQAHPAAHVVDAARGGYILWEPEQPPQALVIATGSEIELAVRAAQSLNAENLSVRVVSIPCVETFRTQDAAYREQVLPPGISARVAVEAGVGMGWREFVDARGVVMSIERFGESAPADDVYQFLQMTVDQVVKHLREVSGISPG